MNDLMTFYDTMLMWIGLIVMFFCFGIALIFDRWYMKKKLDYVFSFFTLDNIEGEETCQT